MDSRDLAALGFLTVGRRSNRDTVHDIIDDWIDVVTRGTMGLSVNCARCHDHKFDPVSTKEYYALYGDFLNRGHARTCLSPAANRGPRWTGGTKTEWRHSRKASGNTKSGGLPKYRGT